MFKVISNNVSEGGLLTALGGQTGLGTPALSFEYSHVLHALLQKELGWEEQQEIS